MMTDDLGIRLEWPGGPLVIGQIIELVDDFPNHLIDAFEFARRLKLCFVAQLLAILIVVSDYNFYLIILWVPVFGWLSVHSLSYLFIKSIAFLEFLSALLGFYCLGFEISASNKSSGVCADFFAINNGKEDHVTTIVVAALAVLSSFAISFFCSQFSYHVKHNLSDQDIISLRASF